MMCSRIQGHCGCLHSYLNSSLRNYSSRHAYMAIDLTSRLKNPPMNYHSLPHTNSIFKIQSGNLHRTHSLLLTRKYAEKHSYQEGGKWPTKKKLAILWSCAAVAIGFVIVIDLSLHASHVDNEETKHKIERAGGSGGIMKYISSIPCMRTTFLLIIVGGLTTWIATFLFTSSFRKAYIMLANSPFVIGSIYFSYCTMQTRTAKAEIDEIHSALNVVRRKYVEGISPPDQNPTDGSEND